MNFILQARKVISDIVWEKTTYNIKAIPFCECVYAILYNKQLWYIGTCKNLRKRMSNHSVLKLVNKRPLIKELVTIYYTRQSDNRAGIEKGLIRLMKPSHVHNNYLSDKIDFHRNGRSQTWIVAKMRKAGCVDLTCSKFSLKKKGLIAFSTLELKVLSTILGADL